MCAHVYKGETSSSKGHCGRTVLTRQRADKPSAVHRKYDFMLNFSSVLLWNIHRAQIEIVFNAQFNMRGLRWKFNALRKQVVPAVTK